MVNGAVEEALDLRRVQVYGHDPIGASRLEQVGHEASGNRLAPLVLLVLTRVAVARHDHGDAPGRRPLERVHHDELLHDRLVDGRGVGLQSEAVRAAHALTKPHVELAVRERVRGGGQQLDVEALRDGVRKLWVRAPGDEHQFALARARDHGTHASPLRTLRG